MKSYLNSVLAGHVLTEKEAYEAAQKIMNDCGSPEQIAGLLVALRMRGETEAEFLGFLKAFRETAPYFLISNQILMDVCGTGGDHAGTFNVSTGVAFVLASCGVAIAKHGNRGVSSQSGSSDVLESLLVKSDTTPSEVKDSIERAKISFLLAPAFYPVFAKIAPIRKNLGVYTLFNALGPLLNPAPLTHQMIGVYSEKLLTKVAGVLKARDLKSAYVVQGAEGLDEVSISTVTRVVALERGELRNFEVSPEEFGLQRSPLSEVQGGTPSENAIILENIFKGLRTPKRDLVVINAAMGLVLCGEASTYREGALRAAQALDSGATLALLKKARIREGIA